MKKFRKQYKVKINQTKKKFFANEISEKKLNQKNRQKNYKIFLTKNQNKFKINKLEKLS